jgi:hypothetical protein
MSTGTQIRKVSEQVVAAALILLLTQGGRARAEEWVIVPATAGDDIAWVTAATQQLSAELTRRGIALRSPAEAARDFQEQGSRSPAVLTDEDIEQWTQGSKQALGHLARSDYGGALALLRKAQAFSRVAVEELNRDPERSELLLDTCLYTVRALLGAGQRADAQAQAEECSRLSLHAKPNAVMHPPDVRAFYSAVVDTASDNAATLVVEADRSGCDVRVNGLLQGRTPHRIERLLHGPYEVQVECDEPHGRVHRVEVVPGITKVQIDTRFDRAIRSDANLRLRYSVWPDAEERLLDAVHIARAVGTDAVLLMIARDDGPMELLVTNASAQSRGFARVPCTARGPAGDTLARAIESLVEGQCIELTGERVTTVDCSTGAPVAQAEPDGPHPVRPPRGQFISGVTLASIGAASLVTGYLLYVVSATRAADQMVASPTNDNQALWLNTRFGMFYVGSAGAAALVTAMPLALPYRPKTPWWAWLSGGAGVALAATSIALAVTAPSTPAVSRVEDPQGYVDRAKRTDAAFVAGVSAAPLLAMPLVYLLRRDEKRTRATLAPQLAVSREAGLIALRGHY